MYNPTLSNPNLVLERLQRALNNHDIEAFVSCLRPDYRSEHPVHPARALGTSAQARKNRHKPRLYMEQADEGGVP